VTRLDILQALIEMQLSAYSHKSFHCKQYRVNQTSPPTPPSLAPPKFTVRDQKLNPSLTPPQISMDQSRVPVLRFFSSDASMNLDTTFQNSLVLKDNAVIDCVCIETVLRH
jgi:hypothetical protein